MQKTPDITDVPRLQGTKFLRDAFAESRSLVSPGMSPDKAFGLLRKLLGAEEFSKPDLGHFCHLLRKNAKSQKNPDKRTTGLFISAALYNISNKFYKARLYDPEPLEIMTMLDLKGIEEVSYLGYRFPKGALHLIGQFGDYTGSKLGGDARLMIVGSAANFVGAYQEGHIYVTGDVGDFAGKGMKSGSSLEIGGKYGSHLGWQTEADSTIYYHNLDGERKTITGKPLELAEAVRGRDGE